MLLVPWAASRDDVSALDQSLLALGAVDHALQKLLLDGTQLNRTRLLGGHQRSLLLVLPSILSQPTILCYFRVAVLERGY